MELAAIAASKARSVDVPTVPSTIGAELADRAPNGNTKPQLFGFDAVICSTGLVTSPSMLAASGAAKSLAPLTDISPQ
ncbi:MAG TPA: hypothetical protein VGI30_05960 [Caulobacteraceae bacterium]